MPIKPHESAENYLETILTLGKRMEHVRAIDIVREMEFSKPSVSVAMKSLRERGYINVDGAGHITLTEQGLALAEKVYEKHTLLTKWLVHLGVAEEVAAEDACRIEHIISEESFEAIRRHADVTGRKTK